MNINLDDKKIVKIIYQLNDKNLLTFNYKDGELTSVTTEKALNPYSAMKGTPTDSEMIEMVKNSDFMKEIVNERRKRKAEESIPKEIADTFPDIDEDTKKKKPLFKGYSVNGYETIKKLIEMDLNGTLDEILKKHSDKYDAKYICETNEQDLDIDMLACDKSIYKLEDEIISTIRNTNSENLDGEKELLEKIKTYRDYLKKKNELIDKQWELKTKQSD